MNFVVSGGFDPPHTGHFRYIRDAISRMDVGDKLVVILTRDDQLMSKKQFVYMPYPERKEVLDWVLEGKGIVYEVVPNVDLDITSTNSLMFYGANVFLKGGDTWDVKSLPEYQTCMDNHIDVLFGVGGLDKVRSSSDLKKHLK